MKYLLTILCIAVAVMFADAAPQTPKQTVAPPRTNEPLARVTARLERDLPELMKKADVPGVSIALIRNGAAVWHRGFGVKDSRTREPVRDNTVFEAASLSKPVFSYAVMKLVDAGKFDLDKPLNQYLPGNYDVGPDPRLDQITARRVLSHTTGFPNWRGVNPLLKIFFTPGERFSYSGEGFVYLAKVIEHITGEKFNHFMKRTVFVPLGMTNSSYLWETSYEAQKTSRHNSLGEPSPQNKPSAANAASSLHTTAEDYARFVAAVLNGTGLKTETLRLILTPQIKVDEGGTNTTSRPADKLSPNISWGLGFGLQITPDGSSFWHWGDNGDARAYFVAFQQQKLGVVVFANSSDGLSFMPELIDCAIGGQQPALGWIRYDSYKSPRRALLRDIVANGAEKAVLKYRDWRKGRPVSDMLTEQQINDFGYELLYRLRRYKDAIEVFKLNVDDYPQSANTWDSLGEAYMVDGNKELAIKNYQRSIDLNPKNTNGIEMLKKLQESQKN